MKLFTIAISPSFPFLPRNGMVHIQKGSNYSEKETLEVLRSWDNPLELDRDFKTSQFLVTKTHDNFEHRDDDDESILDSSMKLKN